MKRVLAVVFALVLISVAFNVGAQVPNVQVFFDPNGAHAAHPAPCPGIGVIDTWHVFLSNMNSFFNVAEYSISYPAAVTWIADIAEPDPLGNPPLVIGASPAPIGISIGWPIQMNGFTSNIRISQVLVSWNCADCTGVWNSPVTVAPGIHGVVRIVKMPGNTPVTVLGMVSAICPVPIPVQESTWGRVKALYNSN